MALVIETFIICDVCKTSSFGVDDRHRKGMQQREAARNNGWVYSGGEDICPNCRVKNKEGNDFKHSKRRAIRSRHK